MTSENAMRTDLLTYLGIAFFGAVLAMFSNDDAAKWIEPERLFYLRGACSVASATLLALKMYRSTGYAQHLSKQAADNPDANTTQITTQVTQAPPVVTSQITPAQPINS